MVWRVRQAISLKTTSAYHCATDPSSIFTDIHDAILPPPPGLSNQDTVVYHSEASRLIDDVREQIKTGLPFTVSLQNITAVLDALIASKYDGGLDDRLLLVR